jgi:hypothetical protein
LLKDKGANIQPRHLSGADIDSDQLHEREKALVGNWLAAVSSHLENHLLTEEELQRLDVNWKQASPAPDRGRGLARTAPGACKTGRKPGGAA